MLFRWEIEAPPETYLSCRFRTEPQPPFGGTVLSLLDSNSAANNRSIVEIVTYIVNLGVLLIRLRRGDTDWIVRFRRTLPIIYWN